MGCACSDKKKQDYDYVRRLANAESITNKVDIQIYYTIGYDGKTKYYDYEPTARGRKLQVVEIIQFSEPESLDLLPIIEQPGLDLVSDKEVALAVGNVTGTKVSVKRTVGKPSDTDTGAVL